MCCVLEYVVSSSAIGGCVVYWSMLFHQVPWVDVLCIGVCCFIKRHRWMCCVLEYVVWSSVIGGCVVYWSMLFDQVP